MMTQTTMSDVSPAPKARQDSVSISRDEYIRLAISRRKIYRWDSEDLSVRGLLDSSTGVRYVIPERELIGSDG